LRSHLFKFRRTFLTRHFFLLNSSNVTHPQAVYRWLQIGRSKRQLSVSQWFCLRPMGPQVPRKLGSVHCKIPRRFLHIYPML
jgi:hypothetical protein